MADPRDHRPPPPDEPPSARDQPPPIPDPGPSAFPPAAPEPDPSAVPPPLPTEAAAEVADAGPPPAVDDDGVIEDDLADDEKAAEEITRRALLHRTERTRTYPCRQCGGELVFGIRQQMLVCPHCGNTEEIVEDQGREVEEQDFRGALSAIHSGALLRTGEMIGGPAAEKEVVCQNCGGHTTFTGTLTAVRCPYCATPIQRDDVHDAPSRLAVDGMLPFAVDQDQADEAIQKWIRSRWFAPNEFKKYSRTGSFTSVYAAYFTYDADTTTRYAGMRGDNYMVTVGSGENRRTEVRTRWSPRSGVVSDIFDDLPVLANTGFEEDHVRELEPWPTSTARPFSAEYIAGHLCRTYDHDVEECFGPAKQRIEAGIRDTVRGDIGGDHQRISSMSVRYDHLSFKHLLLPIWLLTVVYQQRPFQVFINGVTGEVHGQRPYSALKIAMAVVAALIVIGIAVFLYQSGGGSTR
jgi:rubrerythrin